MSAASLVRSIKDRHITPTEVVETAITQIQKNNERTNAFISITDNFARSSAAKAEEALASGEPIGPLHGVPIAIKDIDDVAGVQTTNGSLLYEDNVAEKHSPFVARLIEAGAIVVGKTNTPEFAIGTTTDNRVIGQTSTPFAIDRVSGGSSGGSAAAVGDMLVPITLGSDEGGSIRIPSSFCGVYGFKPTFGIIPNTTRPNAFSKHSPFSHKGPMSRTVEDAAITMDVMTGIHHPDPFSIEFNGNFTQAINRPIDELKIAFCPDFGIFPVENEVRDVLTEAISTFERAGADVDELDSVLGSSQEELLDAFYTMASVGLQMLFDRLESQGFDPRGEDQEKLRPYLVDVILSGDMPTIRKFKNAEVTRTKVFDDLQETFESYDLLVTATVGTTPFKHNNEPDMIDGKEIEPYRGWVLTQPYNFTGHPAASLPAGFIDGLPVGMQLAGRRYEDETVFAASAAFERVQPWHSEYPH